MPRRLILLIALVLGTAAAAHAQDANKDKALVYIYHLRHIWTIGKVTPSVWLDDAMLAKIDGKRFIALYVEPGKHTFRLKDKKRGGVEFELKPGETYYIRVEIREGFTVGAAGLTLVAKEQGPYEVRQLKPVEKKNAKDARVLADPPKP